ncbi:hypothetical protein BDP27DRAFT_1422549 [Rhodocollybia butyracea]|uniref:Uncharacterized protein n=1 Tax=Rhodocollybia butyracea TaxID=206335 RepID=A0A9P5PQW3_9AGAR|nr:hypothetical protein BDP27DRAFT_1422549 [Rhodocollybia butyracea]
MVSSDIHNAATFLTKFGATSKSVYSEHNPILMPQFLDARVIYLSLIQHPDTEPPFHILLHRLEEDEFELMDGFELAELPIGRLQKEFVEALERAYLQLYHSVNDVWPSSLSHTSTLSLHSDSKFKGYCGRICFLLAHLSTAVVQFTEAVMCSCVCQRNILELDVYIAWMLHVKPTWGEAHSWRSNKTCSVVGGITDKSDLAEHSFHAGIPIWYARRLPVMPDIHVVTWHSDKLHHILSIAFPISVLDNPEPSPPSGASSAPPEPPVTTHSSNASLSSAVTTCSSNTSSPGPGPVCTSRSEKLPKKPYPAATPKPGRNKFEPSASPLMPPLVENWVKASWEIESTFIFNQKPPQGVSRGYVMPEAALLANLSNKKTRCGFFVMYVKLATLLAYCVGFLGPTCAGLSNDEWQNILGMETLGSTEGMKKAAAKQKLIDKLSNLTIIRSTSGMLVDGEMEDGEVEGEVDNLAPSEGCTRREKLGGIKGFSAVRMGFGSSDLTEHQAGSYNLYHIIRGWRSLYNVMPPQLETAVQCLAPGKRPSVEDVHCVEYLVAHQYIWVFSDFFRRPPMLPSIT